ncbi:gamma-glutamyltranspeptidase / glutathione hydrolase [Persephonella hydrogeniphila]|uniref:Glutathione hydrolase proenzyme n=1 Tax=Persephonella hydrogeniphila TaxID=198703 RepID=A0A285ND05_9AQUI|nr:gamma-glutamyltransferase [Persephonella hydrogeniphila]SNZ07178.1 gamma-glutamyltranspeptidase / glutathione hydrolase [Persephonella hydrogeniphila]
MKGVISAGDKLTAEAGAEILEKGGNAFDAAIAALLAAPLTEPALTSLGGGGFLLAIEKGMLPVIYDFFVDVPPKRVENPDFYPVYVDFGSAVQEFHIGCGSAAIPGMIAGIYQIYKNRCTLPLKELVEPALRYAEKGIYLSKMQASFVKLLEPIFTATEESKKIYTVNGKLIDDKTIYKNPDYADFLRRFAQEGSWFFYEGDVAEKIERLSVERNGLLRKEDLRKYRVQEKDPVYFKFRDYDIFTNAPPSPGGLLIGFTLKLLEDTNLSSFGSTKHIGSLVEAMHTTQLFRREYVDKHIHNEELKLLIEDKKIFDVYKGFFTKRLNLWGNTTHISVVDSEGNAVSVTTTNGEGSGCIIPGTGIMLNNMLGEEDLNPSGFFRWPPYVRLPSMMSPTVVMKDDNLKLSLGSAGSNRIRSAIIQVILNYIIFKKEIHEAVSLPRIHYENHTVFMEPGFDKNVIRSCERLYETVVFQEKSLFFGGVQAVTGDFEGAGDPRRGGYTISVK